MVSLPTKDSRFYGNDFVCPYFNCQTKTHQDWFQLSYLKDSGEGTGSNVVHPLTFLYVSQCYTCKKYSVWHAMKLIYPLEVKLEIKPNEDLSEEIKKDFIEAGQITNVSPRGAAALLRLCIQKLCVQLGEKGHDINFDIGSLVTKGLNSKIQKALDIVRVIGNEAVHPGVLDLKDNVDTVNELFKLINIIADSMLSTPKRIDALYSSLPPEKLKGIVDRDGKKNNRQ
jgi:hypothetical protein